MSPREQKCLYNCFQWQRSLEHQKPITIFPKPSILFNKLIAEDVEDLFQKVNRKETPKSKDLSQLFPSPQQCNKKQKNASYSCLTDFTFSDIKSSHGCLWANSRAVVPKATAEGLRSVIEICVQAVESNSNTERCKQLRVCLSPYVVCDNKPNLWFCSSLQKPQHLSQNVLLDPDFLSRPTYNLILAIHEQSTSSIYRNLGPYQSSLSSEMWFCGATSSGKLRRRHQQRHWLVSWSKTGKCLQLLEFGAVGPLVQHVQRSSHRNARLQGNVFTKQRQWHSNQNMAVSSGVQTPRAKIPESSRLRGQTPSTWWSRPNCSSMCCC